MSIICEDNGIIIRNLENTNDDTNFILKMFITANLPR